MRRSRPYLLILTAEELLAGSSIQNTAAACYRQALRSVCGLEHPQIPDQGAHTAYTLLGDVLAQAGMDDIWTEATFQMLTREASRQFASLCPETLDDALAPGTIAALAQIRARELGLCAPYSGFVRTMAEIALDRVGVLPLIDLGIGAFGEWGKTRPDLIDSVRARAGGASGLPWPTNHTVLISRSPAALAAGRSAGVRVIGLQTEDHGPSDAQLESFEELSGLLASWQAVE